MMERLERQKAAYVVHYRILDSDHHGRAPTSRNFKDNHKSCLQKIAKSGNKVRKHSRTRVYVHTYPDMPLRLMSCIELEQ